MKTKKLLSILLALSLVFSLFTGMSLTASAAGYDGNKFNYYWGNVWCNAFAPTDGNRGSHFSFGDGFLQLSPGWSSDISNFVIAVSDKDCTVNGVEAGKTYNVSVECAMPTYPNKQIDVNCCLLTDGKAASKYAGFSAKIGSFTAATDFVTLSADVTVPSDYTAGSTSNFGITFNSTWCAGSEFKFRLKSVTVTPVKETVEDSEGTTGYKGEPYTFGGSSMVTQQSWYGYVNGSWTDNGSYVTLNGNWENKSLGVMPVTKANKTWNEDPNNQIGFKRGKTYEITVDYRANMTDFGKDNSVNYTVGLAMLENGKGGNYKSDRAIPLVKIDSNTEKCDEWKTYTGTFTVPEDYGADCTTSNFGIYFVCSATKGVKFDLKSVRITENKMTVDFSGYTDKSIAANGNACLSSAGGSTVMPAVVTDENGNKYIKLSKTASYDGTKPYESGFGMVINQAAAASYFNDSAPIADSYILKKDETYYITLRYKLSIDGDTVTELPVTMLHSGSNSTAAASLSANGIINDYSLTKTDTWRTVTFAATMSELQSDAWNSFGLGFYGDGLKDINFELCLDKVIINTCKYFDGDVNDDGYVDILDLVRMKKFGADSTVEINETVADIDGTGTAGDAADLAELRKLLLGIQKNNPNDSETAEVFKTAGYSLVWNDEFDGDSLDGTLWKTRELTSKLENAVYSTGTVNQYIGNGNLNMSIIRYKDKNGNIKYSMPSAITTADTMAFQYGYLEMRAKMSFEGGAWLSFWMQGLTPLAEKNDAAAVNALNGCLPEVDIFEIHENAAKGQVTPNLHLWKWIDDEKSETGKGYNQHVQSPNSGVTGGNYNFASLSDLSNEYHTYGFLWTPEVMTMYVDGKAYITYAVNGTLWEGLGSTLKGENGTSTSELTESAFHSPMDIILGCGISTNDNASWLTDADKINDSTYKTIHYNVDYIRLYQNNSIQNTKLYTK